MAVRCPIRKQVSPTHCQDMLFILLLHSLSNMESLILCRVDVWLGQVDEDNMEIEADINEA